MKKSKTTKANKVLKKLAKKLKGKEHIDFDLPGADQRIKAHQDYLDKIIPSQITKR